MNRCLSLALGLCLMSLPVSAKIGIGHKLLTRRIRASMNAGEAVMKLDREFFLGKSFIDAADWMVLFCFDQEQCKDIHQQMEEIAKDDHSPSRKIILGEVDWSRDVELCHQQGFAGHTAAAVHY